MAEKLKQPASPADEHGSKRRARSIKRITTPGDQAQDSRAAPLQSRTVKYKAEGPPPRQ